MRSRPARETVLPFVLLLAAACGSVKSPTEPSEEPGGGAAPFTFSRIQAEVFTPSCAKAGCHSAATGSGGLVLAAGRSYGEIVNQPSTGQGALDRIEPGNPGRSYLIKKLRGDPDITGDRMPLDQPGGLPQEQIDGIVAWVRAGAPND
jgi:hypothetical protein